MPELIVKDVSIRFGGIQALNRVSFSLHEGEILGLIGPNGAGKTTMFNCITRQYQPFEGEINYDGTNLLRQAPHKIVGLGIARTFQNVALFSSLSVLDNVMVGLHSKMRSGFLSQCLSVGGVRREEMRARERAYSILDYLSLGGFAHQRVDDLTYATRKRVELARALVSDPKLLLLDEPAGGLHRGELQELIEVVAHIRDKLKVTILVVEHHMEMVMEISDRVVVLEFGRKIAEGTPSEVQSDPKVIEAYLGVQRHGTA